MESERRRAPRYPIIAEAEVTEIASETKLSARTSDLSLGGCFLDMLNPSPEGTEIAVRISYADRHAAKWCLSSPTWEWASCSRAFRLVSRPFSKNGSPSWAVAKDRGN